MGKVNVRNLTTDVFQNLTFELPEVGLYGVIGRNGVGKSTLFSIINGEIKYDKGIVTVGRASYVPNLDIFDKNLSAEDYLQLLKEEELVIFQNQLEKMGGANFLKEKISKYSLGMKELFAFLYSVSIRSDILILDELIDGLDEQRRLKAYDILRQESQEKLVIFTSHNLSEVFDVCKGVYMLEKNSLEIVDTLNKAQKLILGEKM